MSNCCEFYTAPLDLWDDCWYKIVWRQNSIKMLLSWESVISLYFAAISPSIPFGWHSPMTWNDVKTQLQTFMSKRTHAFQHLFLDVLSRGFTDIAPSFVGLPSFLFLKKQLFIEETNSIIQMSRHEVHRKHQGR